MTAKRIKLGLTIAVLLGLLYWIRVFMIPSLIFFPAKDYSLLPTAYQLKYETLALPTGDGQTLTGWYLPVENPKGCIFFSHGNAGNISGRIFKAQGWLERGYAVLLWDYRGYGQSTGSIRSDREVGQDAEIFLNWLLREKQFKIEQIVLMGESLGCYPSVKLATQHPTAALILEAPFPSFKELAEIHYGWIPKSMMGLLLKDFMFSNEALIANIKTRLLVMHGTMDEICPYGLSEKMFELAPQPKTFHTVPGGMHNDLPEVMGEAYWEVPAKFLAS